MSGTIGLVRDVQYVDLPGESPRRGMWPGVDNVVILRKHRDVIFDIALGDGAEYALEADKDRFWCVKREKNVSKTTFKDGEKLHIWVGRHFYGNLILKKNNKEIARYPITKMDFAHDYTEEPKEKPAPIIITMRKSQPASSSGNATPQLKAIPQEIARNGKAVTLPPQSSASVDENHPAVAVVDGNMKDIPEKLLRHFEQGGDKSGLVDIDPSEVATRNWLYGQLAGSAAYVKDNWDWLRASIRGDKDSIFKFVTASITRMKNGQIRFYFKGYLNSNPVFRQGGYGPGYDRIMTIFSGVGKTESAFGSIAKGVAGSFKGNALISFIFGSATAIAEWKGDVHKDGYDLAAALIMALIKAIVAAVLVIAIVALIVFVAMFVFEASLAVLAVGAITLTVGIAVNYAVEAVDKQIGKATTGDKKNTDGFAASLAPWLRKTEKNIQENWHYLMEKMSRDYQEISF